MLAQWKITQQLKMRYPCSNMENFWQQKGVSVTIFIILFTHVGNTHVRGWRDSSIVKNTYCIFKGTKFDSQYPCWATHNHLYTAPAPGDPMPFLQALHSMYTNHPLLIKNNNKSLQTNPGKQTLPPKANVWCYGYIVISGKIHKSRDEKSRHET